MTRVTSTDKLEISVKDYFKYINQFSYLERKLLTLNVNRAVKIVITIVDGFFLQCNMVIARL